MGRIEGSPRGGEDALNESVNGRAARTSRPVVARGLITLLGANDSGIRLLHVEGGATDALGVARKPPAKA
jgi:hypothetical protein